MHLMQSPNYWFTEIKWGGGSVHICGFEEDCSPLVNCSLNVHLISRSICGIYNLLRSGLLSIAMQTGYHDQKNYKA